MGAIMKIGSYLEIDADGYIVNPASIEKIQERYIEPLEEVKDDYLFYFGSGLHSLYIRGSIPKGQGIDDVSDIDTFAIVSLKEEEIDTSWGKETNAKIKREYPFIEGVEIVAIPLANLAKFKGDQIMIKTQSVCLYGTDLASTIPSFKPGFETAQHIQGIKREIEQTIAWLQEEKPEEQTVKKCTWIMKRLVRSGFELTMEHSGKYTRDLYPCYQTFSEFYPAKKDGMYEVLTLAISPTKEKKVILEVLSGIGLWLSDEVDLYLKTRAPI